MTAEPRSPGPDPATLASARAHARQIIREESHVEQEEARRVDGLAHHHDTGEGLGVPRLQLGSWPTADAWGGVHDPARRHLSVLDGHAEEEPLYVDWVTEWEKPTTMEWLVEPFLPKGRGVVLYSDSKAGKSILMLEVAAALATGRDVLGVGTTASSVLYVDFENVLGADTIDRLKRMGFKPGELSKLHYMSFPDLPGMDTVAGGATILARAREVGADLVIFDTASRTIEGAENDNDTWLQWYRNTGAQLKAAGIAYVRMDHTGKDESKGQRGGSAKTGDVDAIWHLRVSKADRDLLTLHLDVSRFRVVEEEIVIHRKDEPLLYHQVEANKARAHAEATEKACVAFINERNMWDEPIRDIAEALRDAGLRFSQAKLTGWKANRHG